jgi:RNA polymerase sigma-70 factor (ECF subfamily)
MLSGEKRESAVAPPESNRPGGRLEPLARGLALPAAPSPVREGVGGVEVADEQLVRSALLGNTNAFDALVLRYQDRVYNLLARSCGSEEEAEDLAQETFLRAYRALSAFRQGSKFYTWLFRIAVNAAFSRRRQETRRRRHETGRLDAPGDDRGPTGQVALRDVLPDPAGGDPAAGLEKEQLRQRVHEGLQQLDQEYRSIVVLRDIEGLDYGTIAEMLALSLAAVKSRLHRARLELARVLKDLR